MACGPAPNAGRHHPIERSAGESRPRPSAVHASLRGIPTPPPTWSAQTDTSLGFQVQYPPGWTPKLPETAGPDHAYYATRGAPAPLEMGPQDVWLTVEVDAPGKDGSCAVHLSGQDGGSLPAELAGQDVKLQLRDPHPGQVEPTWKAFAATRGNGRCYVLWFVTLTQQARTNALQTMLQILAGFKDLPEPAPSPSPSPVPSPLPSPSPSPTTLSP